MQGLSPALSLGQVLAVFAVGLPVVAVLPSHRKLDPFKLARHLKLALTSRKAMSKQVRLRPRTSACASSGSTRHRAAGRPSAPTAEA